MTLPCTYCQQASARDTEFGEMKCISKMLCAFPSLHFNYRRLLKTMVYFRIILFVADQAVGIRQSPCLLGNCCAKTTTIVTVQSASPVLKRQKSTVVVQSIKENANTSVKGLDNCPLIIFQFLAHLCQLLVIGQAFLSCG